MVFQGREGEMDWFQTNPCGVEAPSIRNVRRSGPGFQTNPCGVEARATTIMTAVLRVSDEPLWG